MPTNKDRIYQGFQERSGCTLSAPRASASSMLEPYSSEHFRNAAISAIDSGSGKSELRSESISESENIDASNGLHKATWRGNLILSFDDKHSTSKEAPSLVFVARRTRSSFFGCGFDWCDMLVLFLTA